MSTTAASPIRTVRVIDPSIEPDYDPTFVVTLGPQQRQYYKIPASGYTDSSITFNNLTPLGPHRAFMDTFEVEVTVDIVFHLKSDQLVDSQPDVYGLQLNTWTFDSFPLSKCTEQIRTNINGGTFFASPMLYLRAKERYWDDEKLNESYGNVCPCNKPWTANEECYYGVNIDPLEDRTKDFAPSRCNRKNMGYCCFSNGPASSSNNDILPPNYMSSGVRLSPREEKDVTLTVTWREPIFCSPFSSRYDATYGRPLYNITSLDISYNMQNLGNMIRTTHKSYIYSYEIHMRNAQLLYEICTVPEAFQPPSVTTVPYRHIVPYWTEAIGQNPIATASSPKTLTLTSSQFSLNEIPQAIWIFAGPSKLKLQENEEDGWNNTRELHHSYSFNKMALHMTHLNMSFANTTQIFNTTDMYGLYRIAKRNGCRDSFSSWCRQRIPINYTDINPDENYETYVTGAGSFLRIIPGTDFTIDTPLVPGANADNMVIQVTADFEIPPTWPPNFRDVALYLLFEYVGVATITPGQCSITMNPLGNGAVMSEAPIVSAASAQNATDTRDIQGSGFFDKLKDIFSVANQVAKDTGIIGRALSFVPHVGGVLSNVARSLGYGNIGRKRPPPLTGGAVMGLGDFT